MGKKRDYYEILGVPRTADDGMLKKAYRKLAKQYHPDSNTEDARAEEKFKEATEAYAVLSDPKKRKLYDQFGHAAFDETAGRGGSAYEASGGSTGSWHFENGDIDDILRSVFGEEFHGFGGGFRRRSAERFGGFSGEPFVRKGEDLHAAIELGFDEAALGCEKVIRFADENGRTISLNVKIPAGMDTGKSIRLRGKGSPGRGGGEPGDLLLEVRVGERPGFERKGEDLYTMIRIPFSVAVLGGEAEVETLSGKVLCKIRPGTQSGSKIRLKGKGIASLQNPGHVGDQYVTVEIDVPSGLSEEAKQRLLEFDRACGRKKRGAA